MRIELWRKRETVSPSLSGQTDSGDGSHKDNGSQPDKQPLEGVKEYSDNSGFRVAVIGYIWYEAPEDEKNFTTLLEMINASEAREDDEDFQNPVDLMFERLEEKDPEHFAVKQYKKYKLAAGDVCSK